MKDNGKMRLAFVVQRYGLDVNGGAELLCRWVAERMQKYFEVEVLTTCALDYLTWENHYPPGETDVNSVRVRRFPVESPREMKKFNAFAKRLFANPQRSLVDEAAWLRLQGPVAPALIAYIKEHEERYDLFIFMTYSYLTTFLGLQLLPHKSLLMPAAHDEPHFHLSIFQPLFHLPRGIIYNTEEERRLVRRYWHNEAIPSCVAGAGVSAEAAPEQRESDAAVSSMALPQDAPYLLYVGRVDVMKGCQELLTYFTRYLEERNPDAHLMLLGKHAMDLPLHPKIHAPGYVSAQEKDEAISKALLLVNPSAYESLSLSVLEAWHAGIPVLVNVQSDVLVEHCLASDGGLYYSNYDEFALCLDVLLTDQRMRETMGAQGQRYVADHYSWDSVEKTYVDFIMQIASTTCAAHERNRKRV